MYYERKLEQFKNSNIWQEPENVQSVFHKDNNLIGSNCYQI